MRLYLATSVIGSFCLTPEGTILDASYFELKPSKVAEKLFKLEQGELPAEISDMLARHKKDEFLVQDPKLARSLASAGYEVVGGHENPIIDKFHQAIFSHAQSMGVFSDQHDFFRFLRQTAILLTREKVRNAAERRDRLVVHAIETIDDLDKTTNLFSGRLREFYGVHFPELGDQIENHYTFAYIISQTGARENITEKLLVEELHFPEDKAQRILEMREKTMGSDFLEQDIQVIKEQAKVLVDLFDRRNHLEQWMETTMNAIAPNLCGVTNPLIVARLFALAGSLKDLAFMPSSKIQILGAEKALYRTLKTGAPPPKHGIIFQDPRLNKAKWWQRGKIARAIAGKLAIAARMDYFDAKDKSEKIDNELTDDILEIKDKHTEPAPKQRSSPKKKPSRRSSKRKSKHFRKKR
jgi:nucleolar protein 56